MRKLIPLLLLLLSPALTLAQDVQLDLKGNGVKVVKVDRQVIVKVDVTMVASFPVTIQAPAGQGLYFWQMPAGVVALDRNDRLEITAAPKGEHVVGVKMITADLDDTGKFKGFVTKYGSVTFTVGDQPNPPDPDPDIKPKPTPKEFRVLIVYESAQKLSPTQSAILNAKEFRDYLNAKAVKDTAGKPAWRIYDQNTPLDKESALWQGAMKKALAESKGQYPWILIGDGVTGVSQPLPSTLPETMTLLRKYGG